MTMTYLTAAVLTVLGAALMFVKQGRWTLGVQITAIVMAACGLFAMWLEYESHDLAHMTTMYVGGGVAMAGFMVNAIAAVVRLQRSQQKNER